MRETVDERLFALHYFNEKFEKCWFFCSEASSSGPQFSTHPVLIVRNHNYILSAICYSHAQKLWSEECFTYMMGISLFKAIKQKCPTRTGKLAQVFFIRSSSVSYHVQIIAGIVNKICCSQTKWR